MHELVQVRIVINLVRLIFGSSGDEDFWFLPEATHVQAEFSESAIPDIIIMNCSVSSSGS